MDEGHPGSQVSERSAKLNRWAAACLALVATILVLPVGLPVTALADTPQVSTQAIADPLCRAPREMVRLTAPLTAAHSAMARERDFRVVALGSSSTQGAGASSPKMCYPAQLAAELNRRFHPDKHFEVVNLGVGGEMASDMVARIDSEVLSLKPDLVIWQTGVNDAISGISMDDFRMQMSQGIDAIRATGADVILLDLQYYPKSERVAAYKDYLRTIWQVGQEQGVPVLRRYAFMKHLIDSRQFTAAQILAPDLFHLNDVSYRCLGRFVADAIGDGIDLAGRMSQRNKSARAR